MQPQDLFDQHAHKVKRIVRNLCFHYRVSGALAYQDEAESEALMALWKMCVDFDPSKQVVYRQLLMDRMSSEDAWWHIILDIPLAPEDLYRNFWIFSLLRVRGAVLDFFRSQRLITKPPKGEDGKPTMLYYDRFVSLSRPISEVSGMGSGGDTFGDTIPSSARTDSGDEQRDYRAILNLIADNSQLTEDERVVMRLAYHESDYKKREVAVLLDKSPAWVNKTEASAIAKLRECLVEQ